MVRSTQTLFSVPLFSVGWRAAKTDIGYQTPAPIFSFLTFLCLFRDTSSARTGLRQPDLVLCCSRKNSFPTKNGHGVKHNDFSISTPWLLVCLRICKAFLLEPRAFLSCFFSHLYAFVNFRVFLGVRPSSQAERKSASNHGWKTTCVNFFAAQKLRCTRQRGQFF